jgi:hypothetical protein
MKRSQIVLYTCYTSLFTFATMNYASRWRRVRRIRKCLLSKSIKLLVALLLLLRDIVKNFAFVLHSRQTLRIVKEFIYWKYG